MGFFIVFAVDNRDRVVMIRWKHTCIRIWTSEFNRIFCMRYDSCHAVSMFCVLLSCSDIDHTDITDNSSFYAGQPRKCGNVWPRFHLSLVSDFSIVLLSFRTKREESGTNYERPVKGRIL